MKRFRAVEVTWIDASSSNSWRTIAVHAEEDDVPPFLVKSLGWVLRRNSRVLILAQSVSHNGQAMDVLTIPAGMIKRVRIFPGASCESDA